MVENSSILNDYIPIVILLAMVLGFAAFIMVTSRLLGKGIDHKDKMSPYECGMEPKHSARRRFSLGFYVTAVVFLLFDIEVVFLFPWAINLRSLGSFGLIEMVLFVVILGLGLAYAWRKGALEWD
jgi:NADH-quinone oxidoreductase subunit A